LFGKDTIMGLLDSSMEVVKLAGKIANPELVQAAMKANVEALDISSKNLELQRKTTQLEAEVSDLQAKLKLTGEVFHHSSLVYREGDNDAYCSRCWDVDRRLIHVIKMNSDRVGRGCPQCKTSVLAILPNPRMKAAGA
jgi:hypothetical protein